MQKLPHWPIHTGYASKDSVSLMKKMLELMGNPHKKLKNVIHVGGTNGKGSTIAFLSSVIRHSGKSVNVYTSPHIFDFCERFNLNGVNASNEQVFFALEEVRAVCEANQLQPTVLEASTAAAFYLFWKFPAEYSIIECCMGGLFDCTNVFDSSNLVCIVITSISKDHTKFLGETIGEIAFNKAGIQREGVPSIIAKQKEQNANALLFNYGKKFCIPASFFGVDYSIETIEPLSEEEIIQMQADGLPVNKDTQVLYQDSTTTLFLPMPSLLGVHQLENLATALRVASLLKIDMQQNVDQAILNTKWIGRLQKVQNRKFSNKWEVWFDGAHNQGGAIALAEWILQTKTDKHDYIIIGKSMNADQQGFISVFRNIDATIMFVTVKGEILPEMSSNLQKIATEYGVKSIDGKTFENAINLLPQNEELRIICSGSLYLLKDIFTF